MLLLTIAVDLIELVGTAALWSTRVRRMHTDAQLSRVYGARPARELEGGQLGCLLVDTSIENRAVLRIGMIPLGRTRPVGQFSLYFC